MTVFFLRAYNDIDHITPVIDKYCETGSGEVRIVITELVHTFRDDYRIRYLIQRHQIEVFHLLEFFEMPTWIKNLYLKSFQLSHKSPLHRLNPLKLISKRIYQAVRKVVLQKREHLPVETMLRRLLKDKDNGSQRHLLIFDHNSESITAKIVESGRKLNCAAAALPHAIENWDNVLYANHRLEIYPQELTFGKSYDIFDLVIFPDEYSAQRAEEQGLSLEKIKIIGSARFCEEWMEKLKRDVYPDYSLPECDEKLKIVFFLTKPKNGIFMDEVIRMIKFIVKFPNVVLYVKPHTRRMTFTENIEADNLIIEDSDVPSGVLIDWADLVLFSATSVIVDALRKDKPVLYLRKTVVNKLIFERFISSWDVETRDQLRDWIWRFLKDKHIRTYTRREADKCLRALVDGNSRDVLGDYNHALNALTKYGVGV